VIAAARRARPPYRGQTYEGFERRRRGKGAWMPPAAILDIDGTLVDTNYHHALAWYRAFRQHGIVLPLYRIHRHIGMGGDQLVSSLCDEEVEEEKGDDLRAAEGPLYMAMIEEVEPLEGARELIVDLKDAGHPVVLASSAKEQEVEHYLDLLDARELADDWTSSADVEATKPEPDLVKAAIDKAASDEAVMVGDSTWDCEAAKRAGIDTVAVLTGGFSEQELRDAGAAMVFESIEELRERRADTPLGNG
jgi:HAD superfamily hydrolase (TIGR01549 family)